MPTPTIQESEARINAAVESLTGRPSHHSTGSITGSETPHLWVLNEAGTPVARLILEAGAEIGSAELYTARHFDPRYRVSAYAPVTVCPENRISEAIASIYGNAATSNAEVAVADLAVPVHRVAPQEPRTDFVYGRETTR